MYIPYPEITKTCDRCGDNYTTTNHNQVICPTCLDIAQGRPTVVQSRERLSEFIVRIESLPPVDFAPTRNRLMDRASYKMDIRGTDLSTAFTKYEGRIVLYSRDIPKAGETYLLREMISTHETPSGIEERPYIAFDRTDFPAKYMLEWKTWDLDAVPPQSDWHKVICGLTPDRTQGKWGGLLLSRIENSLFDDDDYDDEDLLGGLSWLAKIRNGFLFDDEDDED